MTLRRNGASWLIRLGKVAAAGLLVSVLATGAANRHEAIDVQPSENEYSSVLSVVPVDSGAAPGSGDEHADLADNPLAPGNLDKSTPFLAGLSIIGITAVGLVALATIADAALSTSEDDMGEGELGAAVSDVTGGESGKTKSRLGRLLHRKGRHGDKDKAG